jgi:hypothetical protein
METLALTKGRFLRIWWALIWKAYLGCFIGTAPYELFRLKYHDSDWANIIAIPTVLWCVSAVAIAVFLTTVKLTRISKSS